MHIHKHQQWKKEEKTENNIKTKLNIFIEIKYLRMDQQKDRMITT